MNVRTSLAVAVCTLLGATELRAASYTITTIPTNGGPSVTGWGINEHGQVTGRDVDQVAGRAFLFDGSLQDIGTLGGPRSWGHAINDNGWITGFADLPLDPNTGYSQHAFRYDGTTMHDIGHLGSDLSYAYSINNSGVVVGASPIPGPVHTPYIYHAYYYDGTMHDIHPVGSTDQSFAWDINSSGNIAGHLFKSSGDRAFFYDGAMHELSTLGGSYSYATAINDANHVTGYSETDTGARHAFFYDGTMHDIFALGDYGEAFAYDINEHDQVVGTSYVVGISHAFLWDPVDGTIDLNILIDPNSGWILNAAFGINDRGQITGYGTIDGQQLGYILTPVPEPSGAALAAVALGIMAVRRARKWGPSRFRC